VPVVAADDAAGAYFTIAYASCVWALAQSIRGRLLSSDFTAPGEVKHCPGLTSKTEVAEAPAFLPPKNEHPLRVRTTAAPTPRTSTPRRQLRAGAASMSSILLMA